MEEPHEEDRGAFWDWGDLLLPLPEVDFPAEHSCLHPDLWVRGGAPDPLQVQHQGAQWVRLRRESDCRVLHRGGTADGGSKYDSVKILLESVKGNT